MVVDTSALIAIFFDEPEKVAFAKRIVSEDRCAISAVNAHEALIVVRARRGQVAIAELQQLMAELRLEVCSFDQLQVLAAIDAFDRFGKGIHPKARLNLCDCAAYALAKTRGAPLLFKGDDFPHTDIVGAV